MSLVHYSSSSEESDNEEHSSSNTTALRNGRPGTDKKPVNDSKKRVREDEGDKPGVKREWGTALLPPLPSALTGLFQERERPPDDPSLHQGRTRSKPHIDNLWATTVYFELLWTNELTDLVSTLVERAKAIHPTALEVIPELHISLTRLFRLPKLHHDRFKRDVKAVFENRQKVKLSFSGLQCFSNDEQTRSFLTLRVGSGHAELESIMAEMDRIAERYSQPTFYALPEFHASFAWALGGHTLDELTIEAILDDDLDADIRHCVVQAERVCWKIGSQVEGLTLRDK